MGHVPVRQLAVVGQGDAKAARDKVGHEEETDHLPGKGHRREARKPMQKNHHRRVREVLLCPFPAEEEVALRLGVDTLRERDLSERRGRCVCEGCR